MHDLTGCGAPLMMLTLVDEFSRQCLAMRVGRKLRSKEVLHTLAGSPYLLVQAAFVLQEGDDSVQLLILRYTIQSAAFSPLGDEPRGNQAGDVVSERRARNFQLFLYDAHGNTLGSRFHQALVNGQTDRVSKLLQALCCIIDYHFIAPIVPTLLEMY